MHSHLYVSKQPALSHQHLTAEVQHSHTDTMPPCCLFSAMHQPVPLGRSYACCKIRFESMIMTHGPPVHGILMQDIRLRVCACECGEKNDGERGCTSQECFTLLELVGGEGHVL